MVLVMPMLSKLTVVAPSTLIRTVLPTGTEMFIVVAGPRSAAETKKVLRLAFVPVRVRVLQVQESVAGDRDAGPAEAESLE